MNRKNEPVEGLTVRELARKVGVTARVVRYYTAEGLLPRPVLRGAATRYGRGHLLRLAAVRALQQQGMTLARIRAQLARYDLAAIQKEAAQLLPELAPAEQQTAPKATEPSLVPSVPSPDPLPARAVANSNDTWYRLTILPGLEVHVHAAASPEVQALAHSLARRANLGRVDDNPAGNQERGLGRLEVGPKCAT
jgi:DNA-binding transcriptional MerR regulator